MNKNSLGLLFVLFTLCLFVPVVIAQSGISPDEILKRVDQIRCPTDDYTTLARVISYRPGRSRQSAIYEVRAKGAQRSIVETLSPNSERGRIILMTEADYWAFFPEVSQSLRIAAQARMVGDIFYGDIARTNFFGDYEAKIAREESSHKKKYYVLELKAKNNAATYGKIYLWVEQNKFWPLKADLYTAGGRLLKTISFEDYKMFAGVMRPSRLVLTDAIVEGQFSVIEYNKFDVSPLPAKYFSKEYLKKKVF